MPHEADVADKPVSMWMQHTLCCVKGPIKCEPLHAYFNTQSGCRYTSCCAMDVRVIARHSTLYRPLHSTKHTGVRRAYIFLCHECVVEGQALHAIVQGVHTGNTVPLLSQVLTVPHQSSLVVGQLTSCHPILLQSPHLLHSNLHCTNQSIWMTASSKRQKGTMFRITSKGPVALSYPLQAQSVRHAQGIPATLLVVMHDHRSFSNMGVLQDLTHA